MQFLLFAACHIALHHRAVPGSTLLASSLQILIDIGEVPSQSSPVETGQTQLPQPFLIGTVLQSLHHLHHHPLDLLQELHLQLT